MKSDVIRKRSRHDARRGSSSSSGHGSVNASETPSASPGASRRPSPNGDADGGVSPTLAVDPNPSAFDDLDVVPANGHNGLADNNGNTFGYVPPTQSELVGALGNSNAYSYPGINLSNFPGPYHPDLLSQLYPADYTTTGSGDTSEGENGVEMHVRKRRRMSNDSATEPPSSAVSFSSFGDGSGFSASSATSASGSTRHSMDFSYSGSSSSPSNGTGCGSPNMSGGGGNNGGYNGHGPGHGASNNNGPGGYYSSCWHPPMLPQPHGSPFIHPPMLPPASTCDGDVQMDFLHSSGAMAEGDHFLNPYIHPPMLLPEPHPPMLPNDWSGYPTDGVGPGASGF
jgi:GATA-binding protein, other eukaryote